MLEWPQEEMRMRLEGRKFLFSKVPERPRRVPGGATGLSEGGRERQGESQGLYLGFCGKSRAGQGVQFRRGWLE